jgi:hypothetical protein
MILLGPGRAAKPPEKRCLINYLKVLTMTLTGFRTTVSCNKRDALTVGGQWFLAEDVVPGGGSRDVLVVTKRSDHKYSLQGRFVAENQRFEVFPGIFVTYTDVSKKSKLKVLIEAPEGVSIMRGFPKKLKGAEAPSVDCSS